MVFWEQTVFSHIHLICSTSHYTLKRTLTIFFFFCIFEYPFLVFTQRLLRWGLPNHVIKNCRGVTSLICWNRKPWTLSTPLHTNIPIQQQYKDRFPLWKIQKIRGSCTLEKCETSNIKNGRKSGDTSSIKSIP